MFVFYGRSAAIPFTESTTKYRHMEKKINIHFLSKGQSVRKKKSTLNVRLEIRLFEGLFACWQRISLPLIPVYFNAQEFRSIALFL